ncbi:male-specific opa-containing protein [Drosophila simulans]|uniref:Male-specific opa-containing protein n=1 Tax=Drosophila mauritiana TaxID=7226 RepID=A0A6P8K8R6_DROMA|nr:male-specific opa-containing protein [Drosophila mauritiana]XP_039149853.1 male-specific opa-containing protein [Drosophila simulans]
MNFLQIGVLFVLVAVALARPQEDPANLPAPEAAAEPPAAAPPAAAPPAAAAPAGGSGRKKNVNHNVITIG